MDSSNILNEKRNRTMSFKVLKSQVEAKEENVMRLAQATPEDIVNGRDGLDGLRSHVDQLKLAHNDYISHSSSLSEQLIKMSAYAQANEVRTQRSQARKEVSEFIKLANPLFRDYDQQSVSNIDLESVLSENMATNARQDIETTDQVDLYLTDALSQPKPDKPFEEPNMNTSQSAACLIRSGLAKSLSNLQIQGTQNFELTPSLTLGGAGGTVVLSPTQNRSPPQSSAPPIHPNSSSRSIGHPPTSAMQQPQNTSSTLAPAPNVQQCRPIVSTTTQASCVTAGVTSAPQYYLTAPAPVGYPPPGYPPPGYPITAAPGYAPTMITPNNIQANYPINYQSMPNQNPGHLGAQYQSYQPSNSDLTKHLLTQNLLRDSIEPFDGASFKFHTWKQQILAKIAPLSLSPVEVLHVMKSNAAKTPRSLIQNKISSTVHFTTSTVEDMWDSLEERFASKTAITNDLLSQLYSFKFLTKGKPSSAALGRRLYELHDLAAVIDHNMLFCPELRVLNNARGLRDIRVNLPPEIRDAWRKHGIFYEERHSLQHPPFTEFVKFLRLQASRLTNPNYCDPELPSSNSQPKSYVSLRTDALPTDESSPSNDRSYCPFHKSSQHNLKDCKGFQKLPHFKKVDAMKRFGRCFLCLNPGHRKAECRSKIKCSFCSLEHNSLFHRSTNENSNSVTGNSNDRSISNSNANGQNVNSRTFNNSSQKSPSAGNASTEGTASVFCTKVCPKADMPIDCSKTVLVYLAHKNDPSKMIKIYCILDEQSNCCLIDERITSLLNVDSHDTEYRLRTCSSLETTASGKRVSGLMVKGVAQSEWIDLPDVLTNVHLPNTKHEVGTPEMVRAHPNIARFASNFHEIDHEAEVFMLVGRNCRKAMKTTCYGSGSDSLWVHETPLGWALVGSPCLDAGRTELDAGRTELTDYDNLHAFRVENTSSYHVADLFPKNVPKDFDVFSSSDDDDVIDLSVSDRIFLQMMCLEVHVTGEGKISAPLPLIDVVQLPDNRNEVRGRTRHTLQRLELNKANLAACLESMARNIQAGYVEQVPIAEQMPPQGESWYMPIFPVQHPRKKKVRLVFDASAKYHGVSLNQKLYSGPDFNNELRGILFRFREQAVAIISDVECMFNNFVVPAAHKDYMRFYWYKDNDPSQPIIQWRMTTHCFGCTSSPAVANFCMRFAAAQPHAASYPEGQDYIRSSFYMDDGINSTSSSKEAVSALQGAVNILKPYGIRLHKILSNSDEVMSCFPESELAEGAHPIVTGEAQVHATLGVQWDRVSDEFYFMVNIPDKPFTKRGMLSINQSLYDPLGLISPCILIGRLLQREILPPKNKLTPEIESCGWDDPLPEHLRGKWEEWKTMIRDLEQVRIPRCYVPPNFDNCTRELHVYSDASDSAIGFVIYMRVIQGEEISVSLVTGKSKVAPQGATTIPRLELNAAVEATQCCAHVLRELRLKPCSVSYYCDSNIVLGYIHNTERRFTKYVTRRVSIIHKHSSPSSWHYVNTADNPADIASRGISPLALSSSIWFTGPNYLWQNKLPSSVPIQVANLPEEVLEATAALTTTSECSIVNRLAREQVSSWTRLLRTMQLVMIVQTSLDRARQRLGYSLAPRSTSISYLEARETTIKLVQKDEFHDAIALISNGKALPNHHSLSSLAPFMDSSGLLRVGGRLKHSSIPFDCKYPVLLPPKHPATNLILKYCHRRVNHQGRHITAGEVRRSGFHVLHGRAAVKQLISSCVYCRKLRGEPEGQLMADLPKDRLEEIPLFSNVGTDVFGHFHISHGKTTRASPGTRKVYVAIFVCLVSRAVHLEILPSLDAASYWNALRRFISIRGTPRLIRSDNGGNISSTKSQLEAVNVSELQRNLEEHSIEWSFNPPYASHFGSAYERKIGAVRRAFEGSLVQLGKRTLTYDEFHTLMMEAACIVNGTPMQEVSDDPNDPLPITPGALLTFREYDPPPLGSFTERDLMAYGQKRWRRVQYLAHEFWVRWRRDYMMTLLERAKWKSKRLCLGKGDVVLLKDKSTKRNHWPMALVDSVQTGRDGLVRVVNLRLAKDSKNQTSKIFTRAVHDVVLLISKQRSRD